jgi:HAD superfamily hydrolase (TIGR01509 family)
MSSPIQAVAFDMDGLMLNTEDLYEEVLQQLMVRRGGIYSPSVRRRMMGLPAPQAFEVLIQAEKLTESWEELQAECDAIFVDLLPAKVRPMPGLLTLLDRLTDRKLPRCVATSSRRTFATDALRLAGVLDQIDWILTAEDVPRGKPFPDIYLAAAERFHIDVSTMLVLEDSGHGTQAAVAAGAYTISVPGAHSRAQNFDGARIVVDSLEDARISELLS